MKFLPQEIIAKKRDGHSLNLQEIEAFVFGLTTGDFSDSQIAALAMAIYLQGMNEEETKQLTVAMRDTGTVLNWQGFDGPIIDKHSTGGVADNVSLILAPLIAACGGIVPMISGRGLGHTGGTLDKLEAIAGFKTQLEISEFKKCVREVGCAIVGQSKELAPADGKLYAIRDVTATVASRPLITASILSKKLAAGLGGLVLDVKTGNGAVTQRLDDARNLARSLVSVANSAGLKATALITNMDTPLGSSIGNAVEVQTAIDVLCAQKAHPLLREVVISLACEMLVNAGLSNTYDSALIMANNALDSGKAAEKFAQMVAKQSGVFDILDRPEKYFKEPPVKFDILTQDSGFVSAIAPRDLGIAVVKLGGGRVEPNAQIDHSVGFTNIISINEKVSTGDRIGTVYARDSEGAKQATVSFLNAVQVTPKKANKAKLIIEKVT